MRSTPHISWFPYRTCPVNDRSPGGGVIGHFQRSLHPRLRFHPVGPVCQARAAGIEVPLWEQAVDHHAAHGIEFDIGSGEHLARKRGPSCASLSAVAPRYPRNVATARPLPVDAPVTIICLAKEIAHLMKSAQTLARGSSLFSGAHCWCMSARASGSGIPRWSRLRR